MTRRAMARTIQLLTTICVVSSTSPAAAKTLFDYFQPTPIINKLTTGAWGASNVQPRDQDNGLEDKTMKSYCYWDGRIIKKEGTITCDANGFAVDASTGGNLNSNTTMWVRDDGSILATSRDGARWGICGQDKAGLWLR